MIIPSHCDSSVLERLHALIGEALALSDTQQLHAPGIALDMARLNVAEALQACRGASMDAESEPRGRSVNPVHNGVDLRGRG